MNMSYCRFQNTVEDLNECYCYIKDIEDMSDEEKEARRRLIQICCDIANDSEHLLELEGQEEY